MTLPVGLKAEDQCPDCGGWHLSAPTYCKKCGKLYCALVHRGGMCFGCTMLCDDPVYCDLACDVAAPRENCGCATCAVSRIVNKNWKDTPMVDDCTWPAEQYYLRLETLREAAAAVRWPLSERDATHIKKLLPPDPPQL